MAEIILALGRDDLKGFINLENSLLPEVYALKLLNDEMYTRDSDFVIQAGISYLARSKGIQNIFADTKFAFDTAEEMTDGVEKVISSYTNSHNKMKKFRKKPDFISAVVDSPEIALNAFDQRVTEFGSRAVCNLTSSRFTDQDYKNRKTTREKNARWKLELFNNSRHNIGIVVVAAADVEFVREHAPSLIIVAYGAYLDEREEFRHPGGEHIEKVVEYADFITVGSAVFEAEDPTKQLERRMLFTQK